MIFNVCLFLLVNIFFLTINAIPYTRYRRQTYLNRKDGLPYGGWGGGSNNPSGGVPGAYYGSGVNPNYGNFGPNKNDAHETIGVVNYNRYSSNWNQQQRQPQQQQNYLYDNNNRWPNPNSNNYYNRYSPGNQGWYATGGDYWFNKGQSLVATIWLLILSLLISINCT